MCLSPVLRDGVREEGRAYRDNLPGSMDIRAGSGPPWANAERVEGGCPERARGASRRGARWNENRRFRRLRRL